MAGYRPPRPPDSYIQYRSPFSPLAAQQPPMSGPMTAAPAATVVPTTSFGSLPPMFILAVLLALIGIPIFLVAQGVLKASKESLESHIKGTDTSGYGAGDEAGEDEGRDRWKDKGDIGNGPLDISDLKGLGGLVGVAALLVISFAVFPDEIDGLWASVVGGGVDIPLVGIVGGPAAQPGRPARQPGFEPQGGARHVYTDPRTGHKYPLPDDPYQQQYQGDPRYAGDPQGQAQPAGHPPDYGPEDAYAYGGGVADSVFSGKSMMEMMMLCKIAPALCDGMALPGMAPTETTRLTIGGDDIDVDVTIEKGSAIGGDTFVVPTSSVERHMAMLRAQPILLIGYDPEIIPEDMLIYMAFGLLIPMLYAFGEILSNAYEHDDLILIDDKVADVKERQLKESRDTEGETQVTDAELNYYKKLYKEREQEVNILAERPWWAGSSWKPAWTEEDLEIEREKDPDGIEMFHSGHDWTMRRKKGYEGKFIPVKMGARFAEMNLKMKKLAANSEIQKDKAESIKKRWADDKKNFYPGMDPIRGMMWRDTSRGTLSKDTKTDEKAAEAKTKLDNAAVGLAEARALLKAKKDAPKSKKDDIAPTYEQKKKYGFHLKLWDDRKKDDDQMKNEALTPKALWLKKEGKSIGDMSLTAEQKETKELEEQIEANNKARELRWQSDAKARLGPEKKATDRLFNVWKAADPVAAAAYQREKGIIP